MRDNALRNPSDFIKSLKKKSFRSKIPNLQRIVSVPVIAPTDEGYKTKIVQRSIFKQSLSSSPALPKHTPIFVPGSRPVLKSQSFSAQKSTPTKSTTTLSVKNPKTSGSQYIQKPPVLMSDDENSESENSTKNGTSKGNKKGSRRPTSQSLTTSKVPGKGSDTVHHGFTVI
ncbi:hypothetical protein HK098_007996 [Nowakowskiella sp. JEL0407]|nr:hypothetical protein HK098_007996 [Nowakowskiella sp. JEL0407]